METESTLTTFTAMDGRQLVIQEWPLPYYLAQRGTVLVVHGLGEHAGRYDKVARQLNDWGFVVRGADQFGHGESAGLRGGLPSETRLLDDLADIVDSTRRRMEPGTPLLLLGHGMGALVAARCVAQRMVKVEGLVLSSPALNTRLKAWQKWLIASLHVVLPHVRVDNGLRPELLSHDSEAVFSYMADPQVHDRISARLARFIATSGPAVVAAAPTWTVPTLLLYAGDDHMVNPQGSRDFAAAAPPAVVQSHCFAALYHELFNESDASEVFAALHDWINQHY